jgi:CDP-6-deoxy-D-xylo-4-hexulose-3-dehydrase
MSSSSDALRDRILGLVGEYYEAAFPPAEFVAGKSPVPVAGRVFNGADIQSLVDASLDFWLTTGRFAARFEREMAAYLGAKHAILVNSGSSANLLAITCLTSPKLGERAAKPGD